MQKAIKLLALMAMISASPAWASDSNSEGIKAYRMGEYAKAEQLFRQALSEETDNAKLAAVYRNLGLLYSTQGKDASAFAKRADELNPPAKPFFIRDDGRSVLINNNHTPSTVTQGERDPLKQQLQFSSEEGAMPGAEQNGVGSELHRVEGPSQNRSSGSAVKLGPNVFGSPTSSGFSLGGSYHLNQPGASHGGILNGRFVRNPGFGGVNGGSYFSSSTPNSNFEYSTNTPIVLPAANDRPVIINSPGPNIFSSQQAPDGSTTIIRRGTY